jgi:hypothetical protein
MQGKIRIDSKKQVPRRAFAASRLQAARNDKTFISDANFQSFDVGMTK